MDPIRLKSNAEIWLSMNIATIIPLHLVYSWLTQSPDAQEACYKNVHTRFLTVRMGTVQNIVELRSFFVDVGWFLFFFQIYLLF